MCPNNDVTTKDDAEFIATPPEWNELINLVVDTHQLIISNLEAVKLALLTASKLSACDPMSTNPDFKTLTESSSILARDIAEYTTRLGELASGVRDKSGPVSMDDIATFHNTYSAITMLGTEVLSVLSSRAEDLLLIISNLPEATND